VSNLQNGPVNVSLAPDAGDIEDAAGNDLAPTSWSFMVNLPKKQAASPSGDSASMYAASVDQLLAEPQSTWTHKSRIRLTAI